jgi:hypothetical protein
VIDGRLFHSSVFSRLRSLIASYILFRVTNRSRHLIVLLYSVENVKMARLRHPYRASRRMATSLRSTGLAETFISFGERPPTRWASMALLSLTRVRFLWRLQGRGGGTLLQEPLHRIPHGPRSQCPMVSRPYQLLDHCRVDLHIESQ